MHRVFSCVSGNRKKCISSMILEAKQRFYGCFIMPISSKPFIHFLQIHWVSTFCLICFIFSICRCAFLVLNYASLLPASGTGVGSEVGGWEGVFRGVGRQSRQKEQQKPRLRGETDVVEGLL